MRQYETIYIVNPELDTEAVKGLIERFKGVVEGNGGQVTEIDEWGKRRLAYPIKDRREGYYVLMNFTAGAEAARDLERVYKITNGLLRYLIINKEK